VVTEVALNTPVVFAIFNRPEITAQIFARIAAAKPTQLFIIADGPRPGHPTDAEIVRPHVQLSSALIGNVRRGAIIPR
jgi:hypothetical protein